MTEKCDGTMIRMEPIPETEAAMGLLEKWNEWMRK